MPARERDFPVGHPKAIDTVLGSPEHRDWEKQQAFLENQRDFPPGHPKAVDTPGNLNHMPVEPGVDPLNPELEAFTGRTPAQAAAVREYERAASARAVESPALKPIDANVANDALAAERKRLGVTFLTDEETRAVLARLQEQ